MGSQLLNIIFTGYQNGRAQLHRWSELETSKPITIDYESLQAAQ